MVNELHRNIDIYVIVLSSVWQLGYALGSEAQSD
jgi:hypothetical protein